MYKTMHEKANAKIAARATPASSTTTQPPTPAKPKPKPAPEQKQQLDKTFFDLLTDVTAELIVESAKLDRLGRYLTKDHNSKNQK